MIQMSDTGVLCHPLRLTAAVISCFMLAGCVPPQAPEFYLLGSYFPNWMIATVVGIVLMVPVRWLLVRLGVDDALPFRLLFYTSVVLVFAMVLTYLFSPR